MTCITHTEHQHKHGPSCGHQAVQHNGHTDYLHDGHLHHMHDDHIDEHSLAECDDYKSMCTPDHSCATHENSHVHGPKCGHEPVPHGDHFDYLVHGHLHHPCKDHCDHHGTVVLG